MNFFKKWYKDHKKFQIRPYADRILNEELPEAFKKSDIAVLAACPNSGKTLMAIAWMENYLLENPNHRILVLTHGQTLLRNQFYDEILNASMKLNVNFTHKKVEKSIQFLKSNEQVIVTLPNTIVNCLSNYQKKFNVLIVDEAHHYYNTKNGMVEKICVFFNFEKQLLLTGTPAPYIAKNMKIIPVALESLIKGGFASDPIVVISNATYDIDDNDFNSDNELKSRVILDTDSTFKTLDILLKEIEEKISCTGWTNSIISLGKTMIFAKDILQANSIEEYFVKEKIDVLKSTSKNDLNSDNIRKFIENDVKILIVVDRGLLGFNLPKLVSIIDLKCGKNISNLFQMFNRITRVHPENLQKYFFKVVPEKYKDEYLYMLTASISLMFEDNYISYDGNSSKIKIPVIINQDKTLKSDRKGKGSGKSQFQPIEYLNCPIFQMWKKSKNGYYWNTLSEIKDSISTHSRSWKSFTPEQNYKFCLDFVKTEGRNENIKSLMCKNQKFSFINRYLYRERLIDKFYSEFNLTAIKTQRRSFDDCIEKWNGKKYNNINEFCKYNRNYYNYLVRSEQLDLFKQKIGYEIKTYTLPKCIELFNTSTNKSFTHEHINEYNWLIRSGNLKAFQEETKIKKVLKFSVERCVDLYNENPVDFDKKNRKIVHRLKINNKYDEFCKLINRA